MKRYYGVPAVKRVIAHITLVASALFAAVQLSAQPSTAPNSPIDFDNRLVTVSAASYTPDGNIDYDASNATMEYAAPGEVSLSDVGVVAKRNLVYMTLDATDDVVATVDVYSINGSHVARPIDQMMFVRGKQRFGIDLPARMRAGTYLLKISTHRGVISRSFVLSR